MSKNIFTIFLAVFILFGLFITSTYNYLLFHSIAEIFSIVVAFGIFIISWHCRENLNNSFLLIVGISYFFVGCIDFLHTFAYKGIGVFSPGGANVPTQLWLTARYIESVSLIIAPLFLKRKLIISYVFVCYFIVVSAALITIFYWQIFPDSFIEGTGLTRFKKISELIISFTFFGSILQLILNRRQLDLQVFRFVIASLIISIGSEISFIFYLDVYGISNFLGHILKVVSFYLIYRALIITGLVRPFDLLYRDLKMSEETLRKNEGRLQSLNETKDKFFSIIAHDLRSPLVSTISVLRYLIDTYQSLTDGERIKFIKDMDFISNRTINLLDNLLDWAKCQTGDIKCQPGRYGFRDLFSESTVLLESYADKKNITLNTEPGDNIWVLADKNMITTVIRNLVSNAIKFSRPYSSILIEFNKVKTFAEFKIKDYGIGIESENVENLFKIDEQYTKLGTLKEKGTGLGLILCKNFVEMNGGEIWCESNMNEGTTFYFTVPLAR